MPPPDQDTPLDELELRLVDVLDAIDGGATAEEALAKHPDHIEILRRRLDHLGHLKLDGALTQVAPTEIGPWRLVSLLGRGGMGEVWLAEPVEGGDQVALKIVRVDALNETFAKRFHREAAALAKVTHPSIVRLLDAGEASGYRYIAMERLQGQSLQAILAGDSEPSAQEVVRWGHDIADALAAAHAEGVVHRDVKPSNIQVTPTGRAVLMDFGLTRGVTRSSLSLTGRFVGSPHYAAPEQIRGEPESIGPQADVYALGATMYESLAGRPPFEGASTEQLFHRILSHDPTPLRKHNPALPEPLEIVLHIALEKRLQDRYPSARALAEDLESVIKLRPVSARRPGLLRRLRGWRRRRPSLAAGIVVAGMALVIALTGVVLDRRNDRLERKEQARLVLDDAQSEFQRYIELEDQLPTRTASFEGLLKEVERSPHNPATVRELDAEQRVIEASQTSRERTFTSVMERLRLAEDLDPELATTVDLMRAQVYLELWENARLNGDPVMTSFFADRVRETDPGGTYAALVDPTRSIHIQTIPAGARIDAFQYLRLDDVVDGGEPRRVPVPLRGQPDGARIGMHGLKVFHAKPPLQIGDVILSVLGHPVEGSIFARWSDGELVRLLAIGPHLTRNIGEAEDAILISEPGTLGYRVLVDGVEQVVERDELPVLVSAREVAERGDVPATVWHAGEVQDVDLLPGMTLRPTAAPLFPGKRSFVGTTPLADQDLEAGDVLLLIRLEGYVPMRIQLPRDQNRLHVDLVEVGTYPSPFIPVRTLFSDEVVMDREVTVAEYREFVESDPSVEMPLDWVLEPSGEVRIPEAEYEDYPMHSVSYDDAKAYAAWRTRRAREAGHAYSFGLPEWRKWKVILASDTSGNAFPWGPHYRPYYAKSCFARRRPRLEPGLRFPIDETRLGLHDTAGSVSEHCEGWFWEERNQRPIHSAGWVHGESNRFQSEYLWGLAADRRFEFVGFRLVLIQD